MELEYLRVRAAGLVILRSLYKYLAWWKCLSCGFFESVCKVFTNRMALVCLYHHGRKTERTQNSFWVDCTISLIYCITWLWLQLFCITRSQISYVTHSAMNSTLVISFQIFHIHNFVSMTLAHPIRKCASMSILQNYRFPSDAEPYRYCRLPPPKETRTQNSIEKQGRYEGMSQTNPALPR